MRSSHSLKSPLSEAKCTVVTISHASHTRKSAVLILVISYLNVHDLKAETSILGIYIKSKPK